MSDPLASAALVPWVEPPGRSPTAAAPPLASLPAFAAPAVAADWRAVVALAVDAVSSPHTRRAYRQALARFVLWYAAVPRPPLGRAVVQQYRTHLETSVCRHRR